jgi:hypothetical protein
MRQRRYDDERLAMYFDYFKFWMLSNRQTKKFNIQRSGGEPAPGDGPDQEGVRGHFDSRPLESS